MLVELIGKQVTEAEEHGREAHIVFDAQEKRAAGSATADAFRGGVKMVQTANITLPEA